ncbi:glycine N-acyltransferase-like [Mizuhopecten yessoensis]|uniref:Glycine N-acyltransferase-like protein n=1 Tax=Mizuhopecten yessoensis TaxID=6573 RepID=A0A210PYF6_MIZYE|nr:glycine N-acyltransferase-like [Mizuhopecten yessoensis]OWF41511.1 Glycine N-phenylacetyltransferase [Mizuhopecten yessoensis]
MIYKVLNSDEIAELQIELKRGLPGTAKVYYVIRNLLSGYLPGIELLVDDWPKWSCILLRPTSEKKVKRYFENTYICYTKNVSTLKYFVQRPDVIDWSKPAIFTGVPNDLVLLLTEMTRKYKGTLSSCEPRFMYAWTKQSPPELPEVPKGLRLSTLGPEHVSIMSQGWEWSRTDIEGYFLSVVERFDSSCLLDEQGTLRAYMCMQYNGSMAMLYIRPQYRKDGYFNIILSDLTRKILLKNNIAYGFIPTNDTCLINQSRELGFEWVPRGDMTWVKYTPPPKLGDLPPGNKTLVVGHKKGDVKEGNEDVKTPAQPLFINAIPLTIG